MNLRSNWKALPFSTTRFVPWTTGELRNGAQRIVVKARIKINASFFITPELNSQYIKIAKR